MKSTLGIELTKAFAMQRQRQFETEEEMLLKLHVQRARDEQRGQY